MRSQWMDQTHDSILCGSTCTFIYGYVFLEYIITWVHVHVHQMGLDTLSFIVQNTIYMYTMITHNIYYTRMDDNCSYDTNLGESFGGQYSLGASHDARSVRSAVVQVIFKCKNT
jgi:hypothetical protein